MSAAPSPRPASHLARLAEFRDFVTSHVAPEAARFDAEQRLDETVIQALRRRGYLASFLRLAESAPGLDFTAYGLLHETIGGACTSVRSLLTVHDMVAHTVWRWGDPRVHARWLEPLITGESIAAFALTEEHGGTNVQGLRTTAQRDGDHLVINGSKKWISFGQIADVFLVFAAGAHGVSAVMISADAPGVTVVPIRDLLGARANMLAEIHFDGCRVHSSEIVGKPGRAVPQITTSALTIGRLGVAAGSVGMANACLRSSRDYAAARGTADGAMLIDQQLAQRQLAGMVTDIEAARLLWMRTASLLDADDPYAPMSSMIAKHVATRTVVGCSRDAVQLLGAAGCTSQFPVERFFRDAKIMELIEGSNQAQEMVIGRHATAEPDALLQPSGPGISG